MTITLPIPSRGRFLARVVRPHWLLLLGDVAVGVAFFLCALVPGLALRDYLNALPAQGSAVMVPVLPLVVFLVFKVLNAAGAAGWMAIDTVFRFRIYDTVRMRLADQAFRRPGALPPPVPTGDLLSRYRDDAVEVAEIVGKRGLQLVTSSLALSVTSLVVLFTINIEVTALAVLPTLLIAVIAFLASKKIKSLQAQARTSAGDVSGFLRDVFAGAETIKVANAAGRIVDRTRALNCSRRHAEVLNATIGEVLAASQNIVIVLGTALVMLVAADQMRVGTFLVGDFAYFVYALGTMGTLVDALGRFISRYQRFSITCQRLEAILPGAGLLSLTEQPTVCATLSGSHEAIESARLDVHQLSYVHPDGSTGINDVSFTVAPGQLVVISGPVGSGKTTLVRTLLGLLPRTGGTIAIGGKDLPAETSLVPPRATYTPQNPGALSGSLRENVLLGAPDDRLYDALQRSALARDIPNLLDGVNTAIGPRGHKLSGGQRHRLAAARMFAHPAAVLVIDDLSAALDAHTEHELVGSLIADRASILIVVSNRPTLHQHANIRIHMDQGTAIITDLAKRGQAEPGELR
ncbi:ATP-binding cassette domain-containing protein [Microlunatus speluncae]|uniref:ATP-binding cassette domain-containing protein n=1 Tax=Microlunatus speluncae TaxID=2594267 RepID=UPI0012665BD8|nr:ABC transporter ATP-binding protein [Microlunatus speluncae]